MPLRALTNLDDAPARYEGEVRSAAVRAIRAGAHRPLTFKGMGMTGVVFCDARDRSYKVGRSLSPSNRKMLSEEAEWLAVATTVPEIRSRVPRFYRYHRGLNVIERECVRDTRRSRGESGARHSRWDVHQAIGRAMARHGWSAPEFKDDSYVFAPGRGWVLVDASMPHRVGKRLAARAAEALRGVRFVGENPSDLAWALRMEAGKSLPAEFAHRMSDKLIALPDARSGGLGTESGEARDARRRARDPQLDKRRLWKDIDKDIRGRARTKVTQLKERVREARRLRQETREKARRKCLIDRQRARRAAARIRARADARAKKRLDDARQSCALAKAYAGSTRETIAEARATLESEQNYQRSLRQIERSRKSRTAARPAAKTTRERLGESDDEVRQNIDPSLHALFEKVKRSIRATPRMSRTEAFLQYVEEHPREADAAIEDQTDALIRQLEARQRTGS